MKDLFRVKGITDLVRVNGDKMTDLERVKRIRRQTLSG